MVRSLIIGMTDYSNQTLNDMEKDILEWFQNLSKTTAFFDDSIKKLKENGYWNKVSFDFKQLCYSAQKFFDTASIELNEIKSTIHVNINEYHINLLKNLGNKGFEYQRVFGEIWHEHYDNKDYGNTNFNIVEELYGKGRDMVGDMIDLLNLANRLENYIGRGNIDKSNKNIVNNNFNNSGVTNVQQNYDNSIGNQYIGSEDSGYIVELISQINNIIDLLPQKEKNDINEYVDDLKEIIKEDEPKKSKVRSFFNSILSVFSRVVTMKTIEHTHELSNKIPEIIANIEKIIK